MAPTVRLQGGHERGFAASSARLRLTELLLALFKSPSKEMALGVPLGDAGGKP